MLGVAGKDFRDATRSRMMWVLTTVFTLLSVLGVSLFALLDVEQATTADALSTLTLPSILLVPLAAIVVGYMSIVGERESGSLKLLLGFPVTRQAFVLGKLIGRVAVVSLAVVIAFTVSGVVAFGLYGDVPLVAYVAFALATVGLGIAFTGLAVGISASFRSRGRALAAAVSAYFILVMFWHPLLAGVHYMITGTIPGIEVPAWYLFLERVSPTDSYLILVSAALDVNVGSGLFRIRPVEAASMSIADQLGTSTVPFYLNDWIAGAIISVWVFVPSILGYLRFQRSDL
ncbi:ABC transporter permease [Haloarchaeobius amylolyticus]|uniref:ABC transporter permease n=1 Tax=Haloarchaeobius amylolyticus TaxID=1198296 RepID=UPI002270D20F|nr:ABC transporter permease subunit [Haloarchaeobius amylolyticus]